MKSLTGRTILLIHGAWHGAWCWRDVVPLLQERGLHVIAAELPVSDLSAGAATYADVAAEMVPPNTEDVVVLAHSLGCVVAPLMSERLDVSDLILVGGPIVAPGLSLAAQMAAGGAAIGEELAPLSQPGDDGLVRLAPADATRVFFHDCPPETAVWAAAKLRPQALTILAETTPLQVWPDARTHYIYGLQDRALPASWVIDAVPARLGITPVAMETGHSPFLSRPQEFSDIVSGFVLATEE